ncbi:MAG: alpha,2-mannosyltransferase, partial [Microbacteriaceae bacterium]|nr:alpha,2-mannosyltransferase [Microbacteriaceae bacterium]
GTGADPVIAVARPGRTSKPAAADDAAKGTASPADPPGGRAVPATAVRAPMGRRVRERLTRDRLAFLLLLIAVAGIGFVARFLVETRHGGHLGVGAYDDGVYYAAAAQLLHGHLPYRDYLFVQPPGIAVLLTPFPLLARLVGDPAAMYSLRVAFELLGGLNAALAAAGLRRFGWPASVTGGFLYAVFFPAVYDERTALLEPLGSTGMLVAVLVLGLVRDGRLAPKWLALCGVALGLAIDVKIWYIVPLAVIAAFAVGGRLRVIVAAAVTVVVCYLPFFLAAPVDSFRQIVLDQLGRTGHLSVADRFASLLGVDGVGPFSTIPRLKPADAVTLAALGLGALLVIAFADRRAWVLIALLVANVLVVMQAPSFFEHYAALTAAPLVLVIGVGVGRLVDQLRRRPARIAAVALIVVAIAGLNVRRSSERVDRPVPVAALQAAAARIHGCIVSDEPDLLATMGVLTRDLDRGCPLEPDMSGISFDPAGQVPGKPDLGRTKNPVYQGLVLRYLRSGDAFIAVRKGAAISAATKAELARNRVLFAHGAWIIRAGGQP